MVIAAKICPMALKQPRDTLTKTFLITSAALQLNPMEKSVAPHWLGSQQAFAGTKALSQFGLKGRPNRGFQPWEPVLECKCRPHEEPHLLPFPGSNEVLLPFAIQGLKGLKHQKICWEIENLSLIGNRNSHNVGNDSQVEIWTSLPIVVIRRPSPFSIGTFSNSNGKNGISPNV